MFLMHFVLVPEFFCLHFARNLVKHLVKIGVNLAGGLLQRSLSLGQTRNRGANGLLVERIIIASAVFAEVRPSLFNQVFVLSQ